MEKENRRTTRDLVDLIDTVDHCARKIIFIKEFFIHNSPDGEFFSKNARAGFCFIMDDLEDDLKFVVDQFYHGLNSPITEQKEAT